MLTQIFLFWSNQCILLQLLFLHYSPCKRPVISKQYVGAAEVMVMKNHLKCLLNKEMFLYLKMPPLHHYNHLKHNSTLQGGWCI